MDWSQKRLTSSIHGFKYAEAEYLQEIGTPMWIYCCVQSGVTSGGLHYLNFFGYTQHLMVRLRECPLPSPFCNYSGQSACCHLCWVKVLGYSPGWMDYRRVSVEVSKLVLTELISVQGLFQFRPSCRLMLSSPKWACRVLWSQTVLVPVLDFLKPLCVFSDCK